MEKCSKNVSEEVGMVALVCEADHLAGMIDAIHEFLGHHSEGSKMDSHTDTDLPPVSRVQIANVNSKNQIVLSGSAVLKHRRRPGGVVVAVDTCSCVARAFQQLAPRVSEPTAISLSFSTESHPPSQLSILNHYPLD